MPVLYPICPTPIPCRLRLARGGLRWRNREGEEKGEAKKRTGYEVETRRATGNFRSKLLYARSHICIQP